MIDIFWSQLESLMSTFPETTVVKTSYYLSHSVKSVQMRSLIWSVFSCIRTEYRDLWSKSSYSAQTRENADQRKLRIWALFTQCQISKIFTKVITFESLQLEDPNSIQIFDTKKFPKTIQPLFPFSHPHPANQMIKY